ncbi:hypothetical protein FE257_001326 [Aspergillus nanangensis]|uniref:AAA+ ATPase domain-containing protein n=1 Tax=Aspergillus nanangensis TaxID=2582783 RepID=A0AAD4GPP7_ASPNN|nr:hypothetical protein FE257_001326 [Aspergillus nanangensis]
MTDVEPIHAATQATNLLSKAPDQLAGVKQALQGRDDWENWLIYVITALTPVMMEDLLVQPRCTTPLSTGGFEDFMAYTLTSSIIFVGAIVILIVGTKMCPSTRDEFAIAIICALTLEADAVEALFDETYDRLSKLYKKQPGDDNAYVNGRIGMHNVVLCYMPDMGIKSAASVAASVKVSYTRIEVALVIGICGGAPYPSAGEPIFLGDVIISDAVIEYDFGRQYPGGFQRKNDVKDTLGRPNREIRSLLAGLKASRSRTDFQDQMAQYLNAIQKSDAKWRRPSGIDDILFKASYHHKHHGPNSSNCPCLNGRSPDDICDDALGTSCSSLGCKEDQILRQRRPTEVENLTIHIGTIASANTVMKSGQHRDNLAESEHVIGFEMEGAGVWDSIPCLIIKGVCDYADSHKNKSWQAYAAVTGACAAKTFLECWRPVTREEKKSGINSFWMVPFLRNPGFVGRGHELTKIEELIIKPTGPAKIAICGLGGVGKTQIALELAYRMRDRDPDCLIFWIPCTGFEGVEQAYMSIAQMVGLQQVRPAEVKERVQAYLSQANTEKWLLIFDNADDMDMWINDSPTAPALKKFLPRNQKGRIIFTTRNRTLAVKLASAHVVTVSEPDQETGLKILKKSLADQSVDDSTAVILLQHLTFLPLAIIQAAAYINENQISIRTYINLLERQESDVIELLSEEFEDDNRYGEIRNPIATTWWISFQQIQRSNQLAADYLSFMACIGPRNIPESILCPPVSNNKGIKAIGVLQAFALISKQADESSLSIHRLVHLATRNWLRQRELFRLQVLKTADHLIEIFPDNNHSNRKLWREYLPHSLALMGENDFQDKKEKYIDLVRKVGGCLYKDGRYNEAEFLYGKVLETRKQVLGPDHPDTLTSMANLASTYQNQGRWKEAEKLGTQVIQKRKMVLGREHPSTLTSMANLALTYRHQGRWKEAEELGVQVMKISKQILGSEHPDTLTSMTNLASTYRYQGRWKEAEELEIQVLEISKQVLGAEHPDTLTSMANLALTYWNQGRWKEAEELGVQVIETHKQVLGPEHPQTLTSMKNLAYTWKSQGKIQDALILIASCVTLRNKVLGPDHPSTKSASSALRKWNEIHQKQCDDTQPPEEMSTDLPPAMDEERMVFCQRQNRSTISIKQFIENHPLRNLIASTSNSPLPRGHNSQEVD